MNQKNYITALVLVTLLVGIIFYVVNRTKSYEWDVNLREDSYQPYDLGFFRDVLSKTFKDDFELIKKSTQFELAADSGYGTMVYVEDGIKLSEDHIEKLLGFIDRGNTAFFSSDLIPVNLIEEITGVYFEVTYSEIMGPKQESKTNSFSFANSQIDLSNSDKDDEESHNLYLVLNLLFFYKLFFLFYLC